MKSVVTSSLLIVGVAALVAVYTLGFSEQHPKSTSAFFQSLSGEDVEFLKFIAEYGRSYGTKEELEFRGSIFKDNLSRIQLENSKEDNKFVLGINKFADWTTEEIKNLLSYRPMDLK